MRRLALSIVAVASFVAIGSVRAAPAMSEDACSLVTADQVSAVSGGKVEAGERHDSGTGDDGSYSSTCVWKIGGLPPLPPRAEGMPAPFGGSAFAMVNTITWPAGSGMAKKYLDDFWKAAKQHDIDMTPVPVKAGDDALFWGDGVAMRKGDVAFGVSVHIGSDKKAEQSMEEALARKIIANYEDKAAPVGH